MNLHIYTQQDRTWREDLAEVVTDPTQLLELLDLDPALYQEDLEARRLFPLRVPRPFIALMQKNNPADPLLRQVMPLREEFHEAVDYTQDPLQEQDSSTPSLLHKYRTRVLLMLRTACAVNCRYCFRRHFPYQDHGFNQENKQEALTYIANNPQINEVILSGGDPLMASDAHIKTLLQDLSAYSHIKRIRIHTRLPVVIPRRITQTWVQTLANAPFQVILVLHMNHAQEMSPALQEGLKRLQQAGVTLLNQAVLLKGVNDHVQAQVDLSETLFEAGILPYYLHLLDKVSGAAHFAVSDTRAQALMQEMRGALPGFLVPRLAREEAGMPAKTVLA